MDDPIIPGEVLGPIARISESNENIILVTTKWGGHLGFHEGFLPNRATWMDKFVVEFLHSVLSQQTIN